MFTEGELCCQWCRYMQYISKTNPQPRLFFYCISLLSVYLINLIPFLSASNDMAFACMLYQREDNQEVSFSGKTGQCVHATHQCFIHQGVRLMYKVPSLTIISSETPVKILIGRWDRKMCGAGFRLALDLLRMTGDYSMVQVYLCVRCFPIAM